MKLFDRISDDLEVEILKPIDRVCRKTENELNHTLEGKEMEKAQTLKELIVSIGNLTDRLDVRMGACLGHCVNKNYTRIVFSKNKDGWTVEGYQREVVKDTTVIEND